MRTTRALLQVMLCLTLAACGSFREPVPEWAKYPDRPARVDRPILKHRAPVTAAASALQTHDEFAASVDVLPFSPEWYAREERIEAELRAKTQICKCWETHQRTSSDGRYGSHVGIAAGGL